MKIVVTKPLSLKRFLDNETQKYRRRYLTIVKKAGPPKGFNYVGDNPAYFMPRADHAFVCGPYLVSRPYGLWGEDAKALAAWAENHSFEILIDAPSSWHPATLLVEAYREEFKAEFWEATKQRGDEFNVSMARLVYRRMHATITRVVRYTNEYDTGFYVLGTTVGGLEKESADNPQDYLKPTNRRYALERD